MSDGCCNHCPTPETIQVPGPEGATGPAGPAGVAGGNAYSFTTTTTFIVPAIGSNVTVIVNSSAWMAIGQIVFIPGAGYFEVVTVPNSISVQLKYLAYEFNTFAGAVIAIGTAVSPSGPQVAAPPDPIVAYAAGTAYTLTASDAAVVFGTTQPAVVLTTAGKWRLTARVKIGYVGATFAAVRTVTLKLRRTNNTASDVSNSSTTWATEIITTLTYTGEILTLPDVLYTTANADDALTIFGVIDVVPSAGSIQIQEASIFAEYIKA